MIGVSKRCCPTCREILQLLAKEDPTTHELKPFFIDGTHKTTTGCTLPSWLRNSTKQELVKHFCKKLRKELAMFISPPVGIEIKESSGATGHRRFGSQGSVGLDSSSASDPMSGSEANGEFDSD